MDPYLPVYPPPLVRPRRSRQLPWITTTWVAFSLFCVSGGLVVLAMEFALVANPSPVTSFASGQQITVKLHRDSAIYYAGSHSVNGRCEISPGASTATPHEYDVDQIAIDGVEWTLLYEVQTARNRDYQVTCFSGSDTTFAVGEVYSRDLIYRVVVFFLGAAVGCALFAVTVMTIIVLCLRWAAHHRRRTARADRDRRARAIAAYHRVATARSELRRS